MRYRNLSHTFDIIKRKLFFLIGNFNIINAFWWKISIGRHVVFDGKCHFQRFPKSKIKIGSYCKFLSRKTSNLIGINRPCIIATHTESAQIEIGNGCGFSGTVIGAFKRIKIGNNVMCGANTLITDSDWHLDDLRTSGAKEVNIGNNVWLGVNSVVLKGVIIGDNSLIGANSVVTKDIPANVIAAGNPCKVIKYLDEKSTN